MRGKEHFRPSVRPFEFLGLDWQLGRHSLRPWSTLDLLLLHFLSRIRDGRITPQPAGRGCRCTHAKCSEMRGIWVDSGEARSGRGIWVAF